MPANTIDRAHQVGKKSEGKTRAILVKFMNYNSKLWFVFRKKLLKDSDFYINEDLTYINMKLFSHARKHASNIKSTCIGSLMVNFLFLVS